jgi:hypothetical protein
MCVCLVSWHFNPYHHIFTICFLQMCIYIYTYIPIKDPLRNPRWICPSSKLVWRSSQRPAADPSMKRCRRYGVFVTSKNGEKCGRNGDWIRTWSDLINKKLGWTQEIRSWSTEMKLFRSWWRDVCIHLQNRGVNYKGNTLFLVPRTYDGTHGLSWFSRAIQAFTGDWFTAQF